MRKTNISNYNYVIVMAKQTIQIRIDERISDLVDSLVKSRMFNTKSEAIRYLLSLGVSSAIDLEKTMEKVNLLREMEKKGKIPIELPGALKKFLNERDRFS